jgi:1-acyl-sn-glycerol-3-phosphate acyltransferase
MLFWIRFSLLCFVIFIIAPVTGLLSLASRFLPGLSHLHRQAIQFVYICIRVVFRVRLTQHFKAPLPSYARSEMPTLVISNHVSWLDIPIIGSAGLLAFISKAEVEKWPIVGFYARVFHTVFVDRSRPTQTAKMGKAVETFSQEKGYPLVLFAEGTTGDGTHILPFKSALLGAVQIALRSSERTETLRLIPLTITYSRRGGLPTTYSDRLSLAWTGDTTLWPHLKSIMSGPPLNVVLTWGVPIMWDSSMPRKDIIKIVEQNVRRNTQEALSSAVSMGQEA